MTTTSSQRDPGPFLRPDDNGVGWLTFDDPERKVNILAEDVMEGLADMLDRLEELAAAGQLRALVVWSDKPGTFIAGADVDAIAGIEDPVEGREKARLGQRIFGRVEDLPIPTVAAIDGTSLGGGTELSLACRYRVASDSEKTKIGFPEVQLGILPAWGGTTRLPRLVGLQSSLGMLLTGDRVSASKARRLGVVDRVFPAEEFRRHVGRFVLDRLEEGEIPTGADRGILKRIAEDTPPGRKIILKAARKRVLSRTGGHYPAPLKILDVLDRSLGRSVEAALEIEAEAAGELLTSRVSKNLIHVFQLRERARKGTGVEGRHVEPRSVERVGILGAGVMGGGIAQLMAYNDLRVRMKDIEHEAVASGLKHARSLFDKAAEKRKLKPREAARKMDLVTGGVTYDGFGTLDLVIEAVVEKMDVKREVLRETEEKVPGDCVLATNTSSLSVDAMAEVLERPENFAGMHFFNPVHKMPLVEVVRGEATSDETVATVYTLATDLGKTPVVTADGPGFLVNRILGPYLNEAGWLLVDGASIQEVDEAVEAFGMPMGPLRLVDEVGVDVARHAGETLHEAFGERLAPAPPLVALGKSGRLGKKGGRGFYTYAKGKSQGVDESVYDVLGDATTPLRGAVPPAERGGMDEEEIRQRLFLGMVNEAARVLEDRIVRRAGDVDLGMIMGTGFPPFRGGLLRFADHLHLRTVLRSLEELEERYGARFAPAPLLRELMEKGQGFYDAFGG